MVSFRAGIEGGKHSTLQGKIHTQDYLLVSTALTHGKQTRPKFSISEQESSALQTKQANFGPSNSKLSIIMLSKSPNFRQQTR